MTYSVGGLIQATDYNGFVSTTAGANVNATWSTSSNSVSQRHSYCHTVG